MSVGAGKTQTGTHIKNLYIFNMIIIALAFVNS